MMAGDRQAEIAASAAALQDLGPGYDQALAEGLVERIGAEIDQRIAAGISDQVRAEVDGRLATELDQYAGGCRHQRRQARRLIRAGQDRSGRQAMLLTVGSLAVALLVTIVTMHGQPGLASITLTAVIWVIVGIINVAYAWRRPPRA
jgi:Flp pilus assembly protein TadB